MATVQFFMALVPPTVTHQEKKVRVVKGKPIFYEPSELKAARAKLMSYLAKYKPVETLEGALQLCCKWCFPLDKGKRHRDGEYKTSKPDTDNLQKLLKDCMTDLGFWVDDAQVASEIVEKFWSSVPGIFVQIRPLNSMEQEET